MICIIHENEISFFASRSVKTKDWDRISKVTQTPLSLRESISQSRLLIRQQRLNRTRTTLFQNRTDKTTSQVANNGPLQTLTAISNFGQFESNTTPPTGQGKQSANYDLLEISPEPSLTRPQPPSILKSDKRISRLPEEISGKTHIKK